MNHHLEQQPLDEQAQTLPEIEIAQSLEGYDLQTGQEHWRGPLISRRKVLIGAAATGLAALLGGGFLYGRHQVDQVNEAQVTINNMLDEVIAGLRTELGYKAAAEQCGDTVLSLDQEQRLAGDAQSWLTIFEAVFGTSNVFKWGLDNAGGPDSQPNATPEIGATSLDTQALAALRIVQIITKVFAHPGAYSGDGPYPNTDVGADDSVAGGQLHYNKHGYNFQYDLRNNPAKPIVRYEGGYDDYRVLFDSVAELASRLTDITRIATSSNLSRETQREVETFLASMGRVAGQFGQNLIMFADNLADANEYRLQHGLMRITLETVFTWNFIRQQFFPFGAVDGNNAPLLDNPFLGKFMRPDPTGPPDLNRYLVDTHALPAGIGPKLAFIAWAMIVEQQISALHTIAVKHPRLHRLITDLIDMNKMPDFYRAPVYQEPTTPTAEEATATPTAATAREVVDGGHPGGFEGKRGGAENIALAGLSKRQRKGTDGKDHTLDEFSSLRVLPAA